MTEVQSRNEEAINNKFGEKFYQKYQELQKQSNNRCYIQTCANGQTIICQVRDNYEWRMNSVHDPDRAAKFFAERYKDLRDYAVICVFGLSDGRVLNQLLKYCNDTQIILIYEPDTDIFLTTMKNFPLDKVFAKNANVSLAVKGINEKDFGRLLQAVINDQNWRLVTDCILPNYDIIYTKECKEFIDLMRYISRNHMLMKNTKVSSSPLMGDHTLSNLPYVLRGSSINELKKQFEQIDMEGTPAIIVSAGPSLDRNIRELKKAEGRAFVIAVDSALKALVREKIHFQMAISVDPRKPEYVFADDRVYEYPYVLSSYSADFLAREIRGRLFFDSSFGSGTLHKIIKQVTGKELGMMRSGGSVATNAFWIATELGFREIILVGQDLAFTDGRGHVTGFAESEQANRKLAENSSHMVVKAMDGGWLTTDIQMDNYRQWFETKIQEQKDTVTVYNATAVGARIDGAIEISLNDAIARLCRKERDFDQIIADVPDLATNAEQEELCEKYMGYESEFDRLREKLQEGIAVYDRFLALEHQKNRDQAEYRELLEKIKEINELEKEDYMDLIGMYTQEETYNATADIYLAKELTIAEIAERGRRLLQEYIKGMEICREHIERILMPELKKMCRDGLE